MPKWARSSGHQLLYSIPNSDTQNYLMEKSTINLRINIKTENRAIPLQTLHVIKGK